MRKVDRRGARNPNHVLTPRLVAEVRRLHKLGFGYGYVAKWVGVTKSCVQKVLNGSTWKTKRAKRPRGTVRP